MNENHRRPNEDHRTWLDRLYREGAISYAE